MPQSLPPPAIPRLLADRRHQFWALNLFGWAGYGFLVVLSAFFWHKDTATQLLYAVFATAVGLLLSLVMRASFHRFWELPPVHRGLCSLLSVGLATGVWAWIKMFVFQQISVAAEDKGDKSAFGEFLGWYTYSFFILLSWAALYYGIRYYQMLQEEKQRALRATSMAHQAQLKMLRYQLNPHFLFNTLNAISTLILDGDSKTANLMITELSKFLRYSLDNDPMQKVDLAQEVDALRLYLAIEKVRFEQRLVLDFDIEAQALEALIPSMLLQPLVENSIKYAVSTSEHGGTIRLAARVFADELLIEVCDDGPGIDLGAAPVSPTGGVGLRNCRERLGEIYGAGHSCKLSNLEPRGLKISIRIPYETGDKQRVDDEQFERAHR